MKAILKSIDESKNLDYDDTFNSVKNVNIRRSLILELRKNLSPNFHPSVNQLTNWLKCLHKSRRTQLKLKKAGKTGGDLRRVHLNNRLHDASIPVFIEFGTNWHY